MNSWSRLLGGILLVAGTTIGAGMLALPVSTGLAGFYPAAVLFILYWVYMTFTALLFLEVNLWMEKPGANIISMAKQTLGRAGEVLSWVVYLFLLYSLTTAYLAGGGAIFQDFIADLTGWKMPCWMAPLPLLAIFGYFVYHGARSVDLINRLLMIGLVVAYVTLVGWLSPYVDGELLKHVEWRYVLLAVSVLATSFGFHIIIPSLTTYLKRDVAQLRLVIVIGSLIPLIVYLIWEVLALGIIPIEGMNGLLQGYVEGTNGAHLISLIIDHPWISLLARLFAFFAIITSFLGVTLSLKDFLADGLMIKQNPGGKLLLCGITFIPPLLFSLTSPRIFLTALEYAGAFGVVVLLGLLPALMVWSGRYYKRLHGHYTAPGGRLALIATIAISFAIIAVEIGNKLGWIYT